MVSAKVLGARVLETEFSGVLNCHFHLQVCAVVNLFVLVASFFWFINCVGQNLFLSFYFEEFPGGWSAMVFLVSIVFGPVLR